MTTSIQSQPGTPAHSRAQPLDILYLPDAQLKMATVVAITALSESTIRRGIASGSFPKPINHGARCIRFIAADVLSWLRERAAA